MDAHFVRAHAAGVSGMEQELELLRSINTGIWWLVGLFAIIAVSAILRAAIVCYEKIYGGNSFNEEASECFEDCQYADLAKLCGDEIAKNSTNPYAYWFLGKALYGQENYSEAKTNFIRVSELRPEWQEEYLEPYLEKIESKIENH